MNLVSCLPLYMFYNSSDLIMNHLIYKIGSKKMDTQLFFCEFKGYIATAFDIASLDLDHSDLDCLFDIYEAYLDSNASVFHFVNSNFNLINARLNLI